MCNTMKKFEYIRVDIKNIEEFDKVLEGLGLQGWELVHVFIRMHLPGYQIVLKRENEELKSPTRDYVKEVNK